MSTSVSLRPIEAGDHSTVLALNEAHVSLLSPLTPARLGALLGWADRGDVIVVDGVVAGFVLTFAPGSAYDGAIFAECVSRFGDDFYYLDRVVVSDAFRRRGIAGRVYDELESVAAAYSRMTLEVMVEPPNEPSLAFHRARGYADVVELGEPGHRVLMMAKALTGQA